jgi:hypothetical protein
LLHPGGSAAAEAEASSANPQTAITLAIAASSPRMLRNIMPLP